MGLVDAFELLVVSQSARSAPSCELSPTATGSSSSASRGSSASKTSWIISQSPSCVLLKSLNV